MGKVIPIRLKFFVEMVACDTVTSAFPVFDNSAL
jgi:hypothetical protein